MAYLKLQASRAKSVTPSDTVNIANPASTEEAQLGCSLYVGGAGDVTVEMVGGDVVRFAGVAAGQFLPIQVIRVNATLTTATNIVALW